MPRGHGPQKSAFKDLTGQQFGFWTVLARGETRATRIHWISRCHCGRVKQVSGAHLVGGRSTNCGCSRPRGAAHGSFKHGLSETPEHSIWMRMIARCENANSTDWHLYGGRGISVCQAWRESFQAFLADMGERPTPHHSIDRIDVNGNYEPGNCRWATAKEQARNVRRNILVELDGATLTLAEACERTGIHYGAAKWRVYAGYDWKGIQ